jgi:anti-sigma B factor antagonist
MVAGRTRVGTAPLSMPRTVTEQGIACLAPAGELDMSNLDGFRDALLGTLAEPGLAGVVVDLTGLDFLDSMGVHVLLQAKRHAAGRQLPFSVINARGLVLRVLTVIGVHDLLAA